MSQCQCSANPCGWQGHAAGEQCDAQVTIQSTVCVECSGGRLSFSESVQNIGRGRDQ